MSESDESPPAGTGSSQFASQFPAEAGEKRRIRCLSLSTVIRSPALENVGSSSLRTSAISCSTGKLGPASSFLPNRH